jgi:hypothetical protein
VVAPASPSPGLSPSDVEALYRGPVEAGRRDLDIAGALDLAFSRSSSNSGMPDVARVESGPGEIAWTRMPFGPIRSAWRIGKGADEAVDFVNDHDIDPACPHLGEKHLQGRAIERGSGDAAVIVAVGQNRLVTSCLPPYVIDIPESLVANRVRMHGCF